MAKTRKQPKADSGNGFISEDERRLAEQLRTVPPAAPPWRPR